MMYTKDMVLNSAWISGQEGRTHHLHPCFMGGLPQVLKDWFELFYFIFDSFLTDFCVII